MISIKGKWALVTGASRGIGKEIALLLAKQGANIILHSRSLKNTEAVKSEIEALGVKTFSVACELSELAQVDTMLQEIDAQGMKVEIVFNDAAVQIAYRVDYFKTPDEDFTQSFLINTIAVAKICYHFMPKMIERGFGRIINTTSGIQNEPQQAGYSASKAALDKFTTDLGTVVEGTDIIISLADPGWCRTDLGGPHAPNSVESAFPGMVVGAFVDDKKSGRTFHAQEFTGLTLEEAIEMAQR